MKLSSFLVNLKEDNKYFFKNQEYDQYQLYSISHKLFNLVQLIHKNSFYTKVSLLTTRR